MVRVLIMNDIDICSRVIHFRTEIVRLIKDQQVLHRLIPSVLSQDEAAEVKQLYKKSTTERANHCMLDLIFLSTVPGKWTAFMESLIAAEYFYLARILRGDTRPQSYQHQRRIIEIFAPYLEEEVNPGEIVDALYASKVLNEADVVEIRARQQNAGAIAASMVLLERIQTHLDPVLLQNKNDELVLQIDPDFYQTPDVEKSPELADRLAGSFNRAKEETIAHSDLTNQINECREEIEELVRIGDILDHLVPVVISQENRSELLTLEDSNPKAATSKLLDHVLNSKCHFELICALRKSDYSYLANILSNPHYKNNCTYLRKIIQIHLPRIQDLLKPLELLSRLTAQGVLNNRDTDVIRCSHRCLGNTAATRVLLDCIQRRLEPHMWYTKFLQVLIETDNSHVVDMIEPDFTKDADHFREKLFETALVRTEETEETQPKSLTLNISASPFQDAIAEIERQEKSLHESKNEALQELLCLERNMFGSTRQEIEDKTKQVQKELMKHKEMLSEMERRRKSLDNRTNKSIDDEIEDINKCAKYPRGKIAEIYFTHNQNTVALNSVGTIDVIVSKVTDYTVLGLRNTTFGGGVTECTRIITDNTDVLRIQGTGSVKSTDSSGFEMVKGAHEDQVATPTNFEHSLQFHITDNKWIQQLLNCVSSDMIKTLSIHDIVVDSDGTTIGFSHTYCCLYIFDTCFTIMRSIQCRKQCNKLVLIGGGKIATISCDSSPIGIFEKDGDNHQQLQWECEHPKCTTSSYKTNLFVLCTGRHLHIYEMDRLEMRLIELGGLSVNQRWEPTHATLSADGNNIFLTEYISSRIMCFNTTQGNLIWEYGCAESDNVAVGKLRFGGIACFDKNILVFDRENSCLVEMTDDGKDANIIEHGLFDSRNLIAFDNTKNMIFVACNMFNILFVWKCSEKTNIEIAIDNKCYIDTDKINALIDDGSVQVVDIDGKEGYMSADATENV